MTKSSNKQLKNRGQLNSSSINSLTSRRKFLQQASAAGAIAGSGYFLSSCSGDNGRSSNAEPLAVTPNEPQQDQAQSLGRRTPNADSIDDRVLVIVDLQGGNDGLSTVVPAGDPAYYDARPNLAVAEDEILALDDDVGLHPALTGLHQQGVITVEGVGSATGDLSHFAMTERWERGDADGQENYRSGFLGRLADTLDNGSPLVAASLSGDTPHLLNQKATSMSLGSLEDFWFLSPTDWSETLAYQLGLDLFATPGNDQGKRILKSFDELKALAADLADLEVEEPDWETPMLSQGGQLGQDLYLATDLIASQPGLRLVYVKTGDFDTHQNHLYRQEENLARVDAAVAGFCQRADDLGYGDQVLVATISEFGRRVAESDGGLDHGSASTMLLAGAVDDYRAGERPSLTDLDEDGNLKVTVSFDRYLATLAQEWLGIEAASVLPGNPEPLGLF